MKRLFRGALLLSALLIMVAAIGIGVSWESDRTVAELAPRWAPAPSQFVEVMGMQVHLRDEGPRDDPSPILLLHGTSASLHTWEGWVNALKAERRVITLDLPGFGLTGPFPDNDYRIGHYVAFLTDVLDHIGVQRCVVGGNSFGGRLAWNLALEHPQRVDKLILVDAAGYPDPAAIMPIGFKLAQIPALSGLIEKLLPRGVVESSARDVYGDPARVTSELVDRYFELTLRAGNRAAVVQRFKQSSMSDDSGRIAQVKVPTLIIWGDRDSLITPVNAQRFHKDIAGSEMMMFNGLGHVPHEEDPAATVERVKRFL